MDASPDGCFAGWMLRRMDASPDGCFAGWMPRRMDASPDGCLAGWMPRRMDASPDGCLIGWMPHRMDASSDEKSGGQSAWPAAPKRGHPVAAPDHRRHVRPIREVPPPRCYPAVPAKRAPAAATAKLPSLHRHSRLGWNPSVFTAIFAAASQAGYRRANPVLTRVCPGCRRCHRHRLNCAANIIRAASDVIVTGRLEKGALNQLGAGIF